MKRLSWKHPIKELGGPPQNCEVAVVRCTVIKMTNIVCANMTSINILLLFLVSTTCPIRLLLLFTQISDSGLGIQDIILIKFTVMYRYFSVN